MKAGCARTKSLIGMGSALLAPCPQSKWTTVDIKTAIPAKPASSSAARVNRAGLDAVSGNSAEGTDPFRLR
jgi:hypothetical protein